MHVYKEMDSPSKIVALNPPGHGEGRDVITTIHPIAIRDSQLLSGELKAWGVGVEMLKKSPDTGAVGANGAPGLLGVAVVSSSLDTEPSTKPSGESADVESDFGGSKSSSPNSSATSSVTCTCATPPKKSVIRVSLSGRLKRSVRIPLCDRMATGSYILN